MNGMISWFARNSVAANLLMTFIVCAGVIAERVRNELSAVLGISQVDLVSAPPYEMSIEVSELALRRHGLTFDDVAAAVRESSLDLPGGSVRSDSGEVLLRTIGQAYLGEEHERLVLLSRPERCSSRTGSR